MWTESRARPASRSLGEWIRGLVDGCDLDPAGGGDRLRAVVGSRRARIGLDDEVVEVSLHGSHFGIGPVQSQIPVDGTGATNSGVVLALLDGDLEVSAAFADGSIAATGHRREVARIFHAIEILIDASSRVPELRQLATEFRAQAGRSALAPMAHGPARAEEHALLDRLGVRGER